MKILFPIFVIVTLVELWAIIAVGSAIGGFSTIALIIITAAIGSFLLKQQGFATMQKVQMQAHQGVAPAFEIVEGVVIVISGILLLVPGFITDFIGLLGLLPFSRKYIISRLIKNNPTQPFGFGGSFLNHTTQTRYSNQTRGARNIDDEAIDGEFWDENESKK